MKKIVRELLSREDYDALLKLAVPHGGKISGHLIHLLSGLDETLRWRAVKALGLVSYQLFQENPEKTRRILRQLLWNLNEESGGIGWGMPEAMGEILASNPQLIVEYGCLLISYLTEEECFLENEVLQKGVIWAIGRVKDFSPDLIAKVIPFLISARNHPDPSMRAAAAWTLRELGWKESLENIKQGGEKT